MKFRKKPVVIEAIQFLPNSDSVQAILSLAALGSREVTTFVSPEGHYDMYIDTLEGKMQARIGDWVIRGVSGELYPCKPDIFMKTYEAVE